MPRLVGQLRHYSALEARCSGRETRIAVRRQASLQFAAPPTGVNPILSTILLLTASNVFMTFAWYAHLKHLGHKPLLVAVLVSWGIAFFEYLIQVPANRASFGRLSLPQLKMLQEVITLAVFAPFCVYYMHQPVRWDFLWAALCLCGAEFFMFRGLPVTG